MDLEERLSKLRGDILAIKRDLDLPSDMPTARPMPPANNAALVSYKLDTLISEYLRTRDRINAIQQESKS